MIGTEIRTLGVNFRVVGALRRVSRHITCGIDGLQMLGRDEEILGKWSSTTVESGEGGLHFTFYTTVYSFISDLATLLGTATTSARELDRQATLLLLKSVAKSPPRYSILPGKQLDALYAVLNSHCFPIFGAIEVAEWRE